MIYRIGSLSLLKDEDPYFDTLDDAEDAVLELATFDTGAFGLWEIDEETNNADLLAIAYEHDIFFK